MIKRTALRSKRAVAEKTRHMEKHAGKPEVSSAAQSELAPVEDMSLEGKVQSRQRK